MKPEKGSKAFLAYELGKKAATQNTGLGLNPYKLRSVIHQKNWWDMGYMDAKQN